MTGIESAARQHYTEDDRPFEDHRLRIGYIATTTAPDATPAHNDMERAYRIVAQHIENIVCDAHIDETEPNLNMIHALITIDLGGPTLNRDSLRALLDSLPYEGVFGTEEDRDAYEAEIRGWLRANGYTSKSYRVRGLC